MELSPVGIRTLSLELGTFSSDLLSDHKAPAFVPSSAHHQESLAILTSYILPQIRDNPVLDVAKLADLTIDLAKSEGLAQGKELSLPQAVPPKDLFASGSPDVIPQTLPIGTDALEYSKGKCEMWLRMLDQWKDTITAADVTAAKVDSVNAEPEKSQSEDSKPVKPEPAKSQPERSNPDNSQPKQPEPSDTSRRRRWWSCFGLRRSRRHSRR
jgi:hypothetical protein